jgi:hypothetical protein
MYWGDLAWGARMKRALPIVPRYVFTGVSTTHPTDPPLYDYTTAFGGLSGSRYAWEFGCLNESRQHRRFRWCSQPFVTTIAAPQKAFRR